MAAASQKRCVSAIVSLENGKKEGDHDVQNWRD